MGASQSSFRPPGAVLTGSSYLSELGSDVQYEKSMGSSRFLKAIKARYGGSALVVKVFVKDPHMDLRPTSRRMAAERAALADCPNVLTYAQALATERAGYLLRQWVASSLYDRISTRPFLSTIEKKWITYQLLTALRDIHARKVSHGDIKSENVLVTSWNWVYLSDFASTFKPTYLPEDDPSDFSYFFDTSGRRTCYLAPERFYSVDSEISRRKGTLEVGRSLGRVTEAMDVFSLGCVIAELFVEGTPPFTLSQLFKYRSGEYSIDPYLSQIEDSATRKMVKSMLAVIPSERSTCEQYLKDENNIFPSSFGAYFLDFVASINDIDVPSRAMALSLPKSGQDEGAAGSVAGVQIGRAGGISSPAPSSQQVFHPSGHQAHTAASAAQESGAAFVLPSKSDEIINRIWTEFEDIEKHLSNRIGVVNAAEESSHTRLGNIPSPFPVHLNVPSHTHHSSAANLPVTDDGPALLLLALVCANLRNCRRPASIVHALDVLLAMCPYLTDETKLDRLLPYVMGMLQNDSATVRAAAIRSVTELLSRVQSLSPSNSSIFPDYVLPNIWTCTSDADDSVRCMLAQSLATLSESGQRYLDMAQAMRADSKSRLVRSQVPDNSAYEESYEASLIYLQSQFQDQVESLLAADQSAAVKRALVSSIMPLCVFLGRSRTCDIFSHLTTYLNDRDWLLRSAFSESTVGISTCIGSKSVDEYVLPLMANAISDSEESVVARELLSLSSLAELGLYTKARLWELLPTVLALVVHPNAWIRGAAASLLVSSTTVLGTTDIWCSVYPGLRKFLKADIGAITELNILETAVKPMTRPVYEAAVAWAARSPGSSFWRPTKSPATSNLAEAISNLTQLPSLSEEDQVEMQKLHSLGMSENDSVYLLAMRDYLVNVAVSRRGASLSESTAGAPEALSSGHEVLLGSLGLVPQNIIFSTSDNLASRLSSAAQPVSATDQRIILHPELVRVQGSRSASGASTADALRRRLASGARSATSGHTQSGTISPSLYASSLNPSMVLNLNSLPKAAKALEISSGISRTPSETQKAGSNGHYSQSIISSDANKYKSRVNTHGVEVSKVAAAVGADDSTALGLISTENHLDSESVSAFSATNPRASVQGNARRFTSTYDGDDPSIRQLLDRVYLDNYREPMPEFGAHVPTKVYRRRTSRSPDARDRLHRRPEGNLIAHLVEHTAAVTSVAVSPDHFFFATGSEDGTLRIWDTIRLEKDVTSRSRQVIRQGGKITSICCLENSHCIASASDNGTIWISRVDFQLSQVNSPRYGKQAVIRQHYIDTVPGDYVTSMVHFDTDSASKLVFATARSYIVVLDARTLRTLSKFDNPTHFGPISCICVDRKRNWLVVGTLFGNLSLWDLRFGLLLRTWRAGEGISPQAIYSCAVHNSRGKGRWVVIVLEGSDGFEIWDIDTGKRVEHFRVVQTEIPAEDQNKTSHRRRTSSATTITAKIDVKPMVDVELKPSEAIRRLLADSTTVMGQNRQVSTIQAEADNTAALHGFKHRIQGAAVRAVLLGSDYSNTHESAVLAVGSLAPLSEALNIGEDVQHSSSRASANSEHGWIVSGGEDRKLRFWDLGNIERSAIICGAEEGEERPDYTCLKTSNSERIYVESRSMPKTTAGSANRRQQLITTNQQTLLRAHQDAISALALLELPFRCIVSADRSGVIKVWE